MIGEYGGWRSSFLVLGALAVGIGALLLRHFGRLLWRAPTRSAPRTPGLVAYLALLSRPAGRWLLICAFFDGLCLFGGAFPFVGAFVIQEFGLRAGFAGMVVAFFGLGAFLYTRFARGLVRRFGEARLLFGGGLGLAVFLGALAAAPNWQAAAAAQFVMGLLFYMFHGVLQARATEALPEARGTAVSAFALAQSQRFPRLALQMVQVGEEAGQLDGMLLKVADTFELESKRAIDRLLAALVPALTIVMTVLVAIIMAAILLPLLSLTSNIQ